MWFGNKNERNTGFTIIELMIALMILVIVAGMTGVIFRATQKSFLNARAFQHVLNVARLTTMRIQNELKGTFVRSSGIINFVGIDSAGTKIKSNSASDEVFFIMPLQDGAGDISEVGYWQHTDGNIMRHFENLPDFNFATATTDSELGLIITDLDFKYFNGTDYVDSWDSRVGGAQEGTFPEVIAFSFNVSDEKNVITKKYESLVRVASTGR